MKKRGTITAIDVGTTKICTIIANIEGSGNLRVIGTGITPSTGLHKGLVVNLKEAATAIQASVRKAELMAGQKIESAYIGVTGRHIVSTNNRGVVSINNNDKLVRPEDLKRVMKNAQNIKVPAERKLLHIIPRGFAVDGQTGVKNPVGMHGQRLDVETHIITTAMTSVQNVMKAVRSIGIDVEDLVLEPLASSAAVLTEEEKQSGVLLADIGGGTTDVAIFRDGAIWHSAILPVAGYQLTRDVAMGLGLPFDVAEDMKKRYASVMPVYEGKQRQTPAEMLQDGHGVSYQDLCDIVRARIEEIIGLVMLELPQNEYEQLIPSGIVFTGGSSNLSGLDSMARNMINLPVRIGSPTNMHIPDNLKNPAYSTAVGLVLWAAKNDTQPLWQNKRLGFLRVFNIVSRLKNLFGKK